MSSVDTGSHTKIAVICGCSTTVTDNHNETELSLPVVCHSAFTEPAAASATLPSSVACSDRPSSLASYQKRHTVTQELAYG